MTTHRPHTASFLVATGAFVALSTWAAGAHADDTYAADKPAPEQPALETAVQSTLFAGDPLSNAYDAVQTWKKDAGIPISVGGWHWWHKNRHSPHEFGYGIPGLRGTYYWYITADPETEIGDMKVGAHVDFRFRDSQDDRFRAFFESNAWLWEAYAWADVCDGTRVKAGKVWQRFGVDWDGCWYGNVQYFDGWKLDPDWGASLESKLDMGNGNTADVFLQGFWAEDEVNGSIPGADAESAEGHAHERYSFIARAVPSWKVGDMGTVAVGGSFQIGKVSRVNDGDEKVIAGAVDATWTKGPVKVLAEYMQSTGERNPANYVTGGPSDASQLWLVGASYTWRWFTIRTNVSHGRYDDPDGEQVLYLVGTTIAVTKNLDLYVEYVRWDTKASAGARSVFEDGFQFVVNWRF